MNKQDWYNMGSQIGDLVQSAIDQNDFKELNQSIAEAVNVTLTKVQEGIQNSANGKSTTWRSEEFAYDQNGQTVKHAYRSSTQTAFEQAKANIRTSRPKMRSAAVRTAGTYKGGAMMGVGYTFAGIFGAAFVTFAALTRALPYFGIPALATGILTAVFARMAIRGHKLKKLAEKQRLFLNILGERDYVSIRELAAGSGESEKDVVKYLKNMMRENMFPDGAFLDRMETCLMTSKKAYDQYLTAEGSFEMRQQEQTRMQQAAEKQQAQEESYSKEVQDILMEGRAFIAHIHERNAQIPDAQMTEKLSRLENVVTRIFNQVAAKPSSAPDLHKMMSYYLPITKKLVDAYYDLDAQTISGENITKTKKEINDSLDTINVAFENLLDSFFEDTAWDVSSDISVLQNMMAQDGLTRSGF